MNRTKFFAFAVICVLGIGPVVALSLTGSGTTMLRQTSIDMYGSQGTFSPVYELVSVDLAGTDQLSGSVYLRGRTGNTYYSSDSSDLLVYSAFADWKVNDNLTVRSGRQAIYQDLRVFSIDGIKADIPVALLPNLGLSGYVGKKVDLFSTTDRNLIGLSTNISLRDGATLGVNYQSEQKSGNSLTSVCGVKGSANVRGVDCLALVDYDLMVSVPKNYSLQASKAISDELVLHGEYNAQTPVFDPQSVFSVFANAYSPVQRSSVGADYSLSKQVNVYGWLGGIRENNLQGLEWRVGVVNRNEDLGSSLGLDLYQTAGLDGDRTNVLVDATKQFANNLKVSSQVGYNAWADKAAFTGGMDLGYKLANGADLGVNYQTVLGGFTTNSKLLATASVKVGE